MLNKGELNLILRALDTIHSFSYDDKKMHSKIENVMIKVLKIYEGKYKIINDLTLFDLKELENE